MNSNLPKISIITPSFNQGEFIEDTILSVIAQGYKNLEYIIIDGGSTDNTLDIIKKYEPHITYWVSEKDNGQSHAINKGFLKATGDILGWLNSDDMYMPNCLLTISNLLNIYSHSLLFGNCIHFKESNRGLVSWGSDVINFSTNTTLENVDFIIQPSSFWTKKTWVKVGFLLEDFHFAFDWEWFLRAKRLGIEFYNTNKGLSLYRIHDSHKSGLGGNERRNEIHKIYKQYSQKYSQLYQLIMSEDFDESDIKVRLIRKIFERGNKRLTRSDILKIRSVKKYKEFTSKEMEYCFAML